MSQRNWCQAKKFTLKKFWEVFHNFESTKHDILELDADL